MTTKIYKAIIACSVCCCITATTTSCSDQLDLAPQGEFTAEQITDESIEGLMSSAYQGLEAHFFDDNNAAFAGPITNWVFDVRSDDAYKGGEGVSMEANIHQLEIQNIASDNATCLNKWENNYLGIARVHKAMQAINDASNVNEKEALLGELKTLRAWFYFDLNRIFKSIPYFTESDDPKTVPNGNKSRDEIYAAIKADLEEAYTAMKDTQEQPGRFTKYVAAALLCKVNAQTASWSEVEKWADVVINSGKYSLYDNFADMSKLEFNNKKESIMAIQFSTANDNIHINFCNLLNTTRSEGNVFGSGDDFFLASQNLVNAFATDDRGLPFLDGSFNTKNVTTDYAGTVDPRLDLTVGRIGMPFRGHTYTQGWCRDYNTYGEYSGKKGLIDPSGHDMVQGMTYEPTLFAGIYCFEGAGVKGDHNCMWDLNAYGLAPNPNVVTAWEELTNSTVLGTWNHVVDYCCAGIVDFAPTTTCPARILAVGLAAYEWNLGGTANQKQDQLERFTANCISYLK